MPPAVKTTVELEEKDSLRDCVKEHNAGSNRVQKWGRPKSATQNESLTPIKHTYLYAQDLACCSWPRQLSEWNSSNRNK